MKSAKDARIKPRHGADVYEDPPKRIAASMEAGMRSGIMPPDFLPPPEELELRRPKRPTTLRLDEDILDWLKSSGRGWQTRINAILRAYVSAHRRNQ